MITIPETDLVVHELCLGSNIFGSNADKSQSHAVMNAYFSHGGNFIDTADVYNQWVEGHVGGESETIIGSWMKDRANRASLAKSIPHKPISSKLTFDSRQHNFYYNLFYRLGVSPIFIDYMR